MAIQGIPNDDELSLTLGLDQWAWVDFPFIFYLILDQFFNWIIM